MMPKSVKKSREKLKNVLVEKRKIVKQKICIEKTNTFTIIAMYFVQEQLKNIRFLKRKIILQETGKKAKKGKVKPNFGVSCIIICSERAGGHASSR